MTAQLVSVRETVRRTGVDRGLLLECHTWTIRRVQCHVWSTRGTADRVQHPAEAELVAPYLVNGGPIGDFCESLRDLVAHVLMWDEINLAVLAATRDALLGELSRYDEEASIAPIALDHARGQPRGAGQYVMAMPNVALYWHAAYHRDSGPSARARSVVTLSAATAARV